MSCRSTKNADLFLTGIYLRLSRDDGNSHESESIQNQRDFLLKYVNENQLTLVDIYVDDGWSGTNFDRPDFQRMIEDVESGRINCIITKDLSRLGRDYIMTGHYIEKYFPEHNVRYIAVNDGVDTFETGTNNDMTPFKAVFNDMYAKDISKKVRTSLHTKKIKGDFIGSVAPYGYRKDPANKNHLIIDEDTAPIVKGMYDMYMEGYSVKGIADKLTMEGIPTPSQQKGLRATQQSLVRGIWNDVIVRRILTNPTYIGNITQNRTQKINYKVSHRKKIDRDSWIVVEGTHEPIVTQEEFDAVQAVMQKKSCKRACKNSRTHLLAGLLYCADCKKKMTFQNDSGERFYTVCTTFRRYYAEKLCTSHRVREDILEKDVIRLLREQAQRYLDKDEIVKKCEDVDTGEGSLTAQRVRLDGKLKELSRTTTNAYMDKARGILSEADFIEISKAIGRERDVITRQIADVDRRIALIHETFGQRNDNEMKSLLERFLQFEDISHSMLVMLIDKIIINNDRSYQIYFNFHI